MTTAKSFRGPLEEPRHFIPASVKVDGESARKHAVRCLHLVESFDLGVREPKPEPVPRLSPWRSHDINGAIRRDPEPVSVGAFLIDIEKRLAVCHSMRAGLRQLTEDTSPRGSLRRTKQTCSQAAQPEA